MFARWGYLVYRYRWVVLALSILLCIGTGLALSGGGELKSSNLTNAESIRASNLMSQELPHTGGDASFNLIFGSATLHATDPRFRAAVAAALAPLRHDRRVGAIDTPYNTAPAAAATMLSRDGRHALVSVAVKDDFETARHEYASLRAQVRSPTLQVVAANGIALAHGYDQYLQGDLQRAERVSLPLALLLLLLVFGTVVAALLPLGVGLLAVVGGLAGVYLLAHVTDVSQYALNIVTLIGLGVAIDYSLFIVSRFREELARGATTPDALARTMATAGRAIAFSGLTVAIGLAGLIFYQGTFLASMGVVGAIVVAFAVVYGLTFLPAVLALLGPRVNTWRLPLPRPRGDGGFWHALATGVMRRPVLVLVVTLPLLVLAGSPFLHIRLANSDVTALPPNAEVHRGYDLLRAQFPDQNQTFIGVVVYYPLGSPLTAPRVGALYDLSRAIARLPDVQQVQGPLNLGPTLDRAAYQRLYTGPRGALPTAMRQALRQSVGAHIAVLDALTTQPASSDAARAIVRGIRAMHMGDGGQILVTYQTAFDIDAINLIEQQTPAALAFIVAMTYLVLFLLFGSVILPLKAVLTDVLSITASFGALVWVFQDGHLSKLLNITPAPLDPTVPILLFCIVFGLSMDYEVLLLSRMKEVYDATGDNRRAVAGGLERSGRLITSAAAIMVVVFCAFGLAQVSLIKAIGLGMALAVAVDATIVRALVVPAVMRLLGNLNWWAPHPLARLHRRLGLEEPAEPRAPAA